MDKVRISAAHLAPLVVDSESLIVRYFGFLNKGAFEEKHERLLTPPGGVLLALPAGEKKLVEEFGAFDWGKRVRDGVDARFFVKPGREEGALDLIEAGDPLHVEQTGDREFLEELATREILKIQREPVLTKVELDTIQAVRLGTFRQPLPDDGVGTSSQALTDVVSRRIFICWGLIVSPAIRAKLESSDMVELLTEEEVATTKGGRCKGISAKGSKLGDNLFGVPDEWVKTLLAAI